MKAFLFAFIAIFLVSCGKNSLPWKPETVYVDSTEPAKAEMYSYELGDKSCTTGNHEFYTVDQACQALLDNELNNNCVEEERLELYESHCAISANS